MSPSQIKTSEDICGAQQERAALAGGAKAGATNNGHTKVVAAVTAWLAGGVRIRNKHTGELARVLHGKSPKGNWRVSNKLAGWSGWKEKHLFQHWEPAEQVITRSVPLKYF